MWKVRLNPPASAALKTTRRGSGASRGSSSIASSRLPILFVAVAKLTSRATAAIPEPQREAWTKHSVNGFKDKDGFERELVRHVETTLARSMYNCDENAAYSAAALAFRDRLILDWNRTQQRQTYRDSKRVYYLSLEFLMGRALDNAMLNIGQKDVAKGEACLLNVETGEPYADA